MIYFAIIAKNINSKIVLSLNNNFMVALEGNFVYLDYQSLKDYFSKTTKWKLNILGSMCF